ncbi:MAG TPA: hypothetical protein VGO07_05865 [Candidatus Saccharimonadales bacterium]|nr:hypothetical protein [Candidatus Saccharimonadales bacterium]
MEEPGKPKRHSQKYRISWRAIVGILFGALLVLGIRFATYSPEQIHYHANFAVYLNGQRETFKSPMYYEEVSGSCALGKDVKPAQRVHLHDEVADVVHVHDHAVTWGDLFMNLHWAVGPDFIRTPSKIYVAGDGQRITYIVNGQSLDDISTEVIKDEDRLLVDFGDTTDAAIQQEFKNVASSAHQYDIGKDPAACLGNVAPTWKDRLKHLF